MATTWSHHPGEGAVRCMQQAMHGLEGNIDYINAHWDKYPSRGYSGTQRHAKRVWRQCPVDWLDQITLWPLSGRSRCSGGHLFPINDGR
jgi:hypothetical protein